MGLWKESPGQAALLSAAITHEAPPLHNTQTNSGQAAKHFPLEMTSNIMKKHKHRENRKCTVFNSASFQVSIRFPKHLHGHKFSLDQYVSLVFLFALVRKIQWPGRSGEEMSKCKWFAGEIRNSVKINSMYSRQPHNYPSPYPTQKETTEGRIEKKRESFNIRY